MLELGVPRLATQLLRWGGGGEPGGGTRLLRWGGGGKGGGASPVHLLS